MNTTTLNPVLEIRRTFDAPPERVFDAWMSHEEFQAWIGPEGINCDVPLFEPRVGGRYHIDMKMTDGSIVPVSGEFKVIDKPNRIVLTWGWAGDPNRTTTVTLNFRAVDGKTELMLRHEGLATEQDRESHAKGWNSALNKLQRHVEGAHA
ncbi:MAG TPA: SRPBCC domain-containing protein [Rhizomicrobium sp.]|jgi:uncharacterized protein YndB with AHSA1/START domain|nr:SRPBCC domain-containing protein [Rhizomicrobium sp.]